MGIFNIKREPIYVYFQVRFTVRFLHKIRPRFCVFEKLWCFFLAPEIVHLSDAYYLLCYRIR